MGAVIQALTGSTNRDEVSVMAKQATEVASLVISLAQALATSMSQVTQTGTLHTANIPTVSFLCEKSLDTWVPQVSRKKLCTQICQQACDWLVSAALANHRPADKYVCIIFPTHFRDPSVSTFVTQHTKSRPRDRVFFQTRGISLCLLDSKVKLYYFSEEEF